MPESSLAEVYFIAIMMFLIIILCTAATYIFFRQFNREKKMRELEKQKKLADKQKAEAAQTEQVNN